MVFVFFNKVFTAVYELIKCFQRRSCPKKGKKQHSIGIKSFYSGTFYGFGY